MVRGGYRCGGPGRCEEGHEPAADEQSGKGRADGAEPGSGARGTCQQQRCAKQGEKYGGARSHFLLGHELGALGRVACQLRKHGRVRHLVEREAGIVEQEHTTGVSAI